MRLLIGFSIPFFTSSLFGTSAGLFAAVIVAVGAFIYDLAKYNEMANLYLGEVQVDQADEDSIEDCEELHYVPQDV